MATVNFLYRSIKPRAFLSIRLLFRHENNDMVYEAKTKLEVTKLYWEKQHNLTRQKSIEFINLQNKIKSEISNIENHILNKFNTVNPKAVNKEWLKHQLNVYYNPIFDKKLPLDLLNYIDVYIDFKKNEFSSSSIKKCYVNKNLLSRFDESKKNITLISEVDLKFKKDFEDYCYENMYSKNTIARALRFFKTVCRHAMSQGMETSYQLQSIKAKYEKVDIVYLNEDDIKLIENLGEDKINESQTNARDWLIISCHCGQRVSDFMRFTKEMIRYEIKNEVKKPLIEFTQKKTGKLMTIPLDKKIMEILSKRNGEFPKAISDQKYNLYIKQVCQIAEIKDKVKGSIIAETIPKSKIYRKINGIYEKWELVTSHIGRRSFATNRYGTIPTTFLIYITGHSTEAMFLNYIGKSNKDLAMSITDYF